MLKPKKIKEDCYIIVDEEKDAILCLRKERTKLESKSIKVAEEFIDKLKTSNQLKRLTTLLTNNNIKK